MNTLPQYLSSAKALRDHFKTNIPLAERGDVFAEFVKKLVPFTDFGKQFEEPHLSTKKSYDKGIDLHAFRESGDRLAIQAKFSIDEVIEFDTILNKFREESLDNDGIRQLPLFSPTPNLKLNRRAYYMIVTTSQLDGIIGRYKERKNLSSRDFYDVLIDEGRLEIIDGNFIYNIMKGEFTKKYQLDIDMTLKFEKDFINLDNVYIGILSSNVLKNLYNDYGVALFFENIRDYLGEYSGGSDKKEEAVNHQIMRTVRNEPQHLLSRNNGLTFKANKVEQIDDKTLKLHNASIVNGCQTTISIVRFSDEVCHVVAKVVETTDAWAITRSTNYQNVVERIDLELAPYFRSPLLQRQSKLAGVSLSTVNDLIDSIYQDQIDYDEMRSIFVGLFSNDPNNAIFNNYERLKLELLSYIFSKDPDGNELFTNLFLIQSHSGECMKYVQDNLSKEDIEEYKRFFESPKYRAYVTLLAVSSALQTDVSKRPTEPEAEYKLIQKFVEGAHNLIKTDLSDLKENYRDAVNAMIYAIKKSVPNERSRQMHRFFTVDVFSVLIKDIQEVRRRFGR